MNDWICRVVNEDGIGTCMVHDTTKTVAMQVMGCEGCSRRRRCKGPKVKKEKSIKQES